MSASRIGSFGLKSTKSYERKTPLEHILLRPGMYIGQVHVNSKPAWIVSAKGDQIVKQECAFSPGFVKVRRRFVALVRIMYSAIIYADVYISV